MQDVTAAHKEWMGWELCPEPGSSAWYDEPSPNWSYLEMVKGSWGGTFEASTHRRSLGFWRGVYGGCPLPNPSPPNIFTRRTRSITALGRAGWGGRSAGRSPPALPWCGTPPARGSAPPPALLLPLLAALLRAPAHGKRDPPTHPHLYTPTHGPPLLLSPSPRDPFSAKLCQLALTPPLLSPPNLKIPFLPPPAGQQ